MTQQNNWRASAHHQNWLWQQADNLFDFFQWPSIDPQGGFFELSDKGAPLAPQPATGKSLHISTRLAHCYAIGQLLGRPGSADIVDHGLNFIWQRHRDPQHGGYFASVGADGPVDASKQAYGLSFVLLAAASGTLVGHPLAPKILEDAIDVLDRKYWDKETGVVREEFAPDWSEISQYRGGNSNMHATEALIAVYEATGEQRFLDMATRIATFMIQKIALGQDGRVAEHFDAYWSVDFNFPGDGDMFRPAGTTPGHWFSWARLLMEIWTLDKRTSTWMPDAARTLFFSALQRGWDDEKGALFYTVDWNDKPILRHKLWWPLCELISSAAYLSAHLQDPEIEVWYQRGWNVAARHFIDSENGAWRAQLSEDLKPQSTLFKGKPDIYHALQSCLIPMHPAKGSLSRAVQNQSTSNLSD